MNITYLLKKYPDKPWDWSKLSQNENITMSDVLNNPDKPWDWSLLSHNENITISDILNNPDKPWDWSGLSRNKDITIEFIEKNIDKINFSKLSSNTFIDKEPFLELLNKKLPAELNLIIIIYFTKLLKPLKYEKTKIK